MSVRVILSEQQLREYTSPGVYLDASDSSKITGNVEISPKDMMFDDDDNIIPSEPETTDDLADTMYRDVYPTSVFSKTGPTGIIDADGEPEFRRFGSRNESVKKKSLTENGNSLGKTIRYTVPRKIMDALRSNLNNFKGNEDVEGYDRLNFIVGENGVLQYGEMIRLKNYFEKQVNLKTDSGVRAYNMLCGDELKCWINASLSNLSKITQTKKDNMSKLGFGAIKSAPKGSNLLSMNNKKH